MYNTCVVYEITKISRKSLCQQRQFFCLALAMHIYQKHIFCTCDWKYLVIQNSGFRQAMVYVLKKKSNLYHSHPEYSIKRLPHLVQLINSDVFHTSLFEAENSLVIGLLSTVSHCQSVTSADPAKEGFYRQSFYRFECTVFNIYIFISDHSCICEAPDKEMLPVGCLCIPVAERGHFTCAYWTTQDSELSCAHYLDCLDALNKEHSDKEWTVHNQAEQHKIISGSIMQTK